MQYYLDNFFLSKSLVHDGELIFSPAAAAPTRRSNFRKSEATATGETIGSSMCK